MMRGRMLDAATMLLALALDDLVLAAALWLAIPRRHRHGVAAWSTSLLLQAFSFTLIGMRGDASLVEVVSLVAINASSALSLSLELAAIREFAKKPYAQTWHVAAVLGGAVVAAVLTRHPAARIAVMSLAIAAGFVAIGVAGRRLGADVPGRGHRLLWLGAWCACIIFIVRALVSVLAPTRLGLQQAPFAAAITFAGHVVTLVMSLGFLLLQRERQEQETERLAMTDALTGVYNRRTLFELGEKELSRARRTRASLSLIILDLDHFKKINDKFGHLGGDAVLLRFVEVVKGCLRASDVLTRYGGEEFCILLPDVGAAGAKVVGERIRAAIEGSTFFIGAIALKVTSSAGVATLPTGGAEITLSTLVARADQALYIAKRDGRNRVSVAKAA